MVKLTVELIEQAAQYTNPVRDRELDLRGIFTFSNSVSVTYTCTDRRALKYDNHLACGFT